MRRSKLTWFGALTAALLLVGTGCSDDGGGDDATTTTAEGASTATSTPDGGDDEPLEPITIRYQDAGPQLAQFPVYVAAAEGYFEEEGIDFVQNAPIFSASGIMQAVTEGDADISYGGGIAVLPLAQADRGVVTVAVENNLVNNQIILTTATMDRLEEEEGITLDSPVEEKFEALRGMTIASPPVGSLTQDFLRIGLQTFDIDPDSDVTIQPLPDSAAIIAAVREGQVDGSVGSVGFTVPLEVEGVGAIFIDYATELPELSALPFITISTSESFLAENREGVLRFLRAVQRANEDIAVGLTDDQLTRLREGFFADTDPAAFDRAIELSVPTVVTTFIPTEAEFDNLVAAYNLSAENPFDGTLEDVFDTSVAEELEADG